jgi:serine/threonine protein kinase/beta-lactam-binding protein with PASTA domain
MVFPTFVNGHDLAGRYRILEQLGVGSTAEVYLAEDLSLHRRVIVKVLLPSLAEHEGVRRAFRDRIVRAATLSHPHLARVFDGGQESGAIFMITEYLEGGSLEDILATGRVLSVDDTARLGRDVASALSYVHANGFVHADLSPDKLLFDDEGRVRVSDIALAGLGDAYRDRLSLDDVRYLSPEQALGEPAGPESDVYSLALILFEAATGVSAFDGLSVDSVLRARINSPLPVRVELGTLDMLLAQAAVSDPRLRLNAEQFSNRLGAAVSDSAPLILHNQHGEVPILAQFTPTEARTSIGFRPPSPDQVAGTASHPRTPPVRVRAPRYDEPDGGAPPAHVAPRRSAPYGYEPLPPGRSSRPRRLGYLVAAALIVIVAVGAGAVWKLGLLSQEHVVPNLTNLTFQQASQLLKGDGFTLTINQHAVSQSVPANDILGQSPAAGTKSKSGLDITVTISSGPTLVTLPTGLLGHTCAFDTAKLALAKITAQCPSSESRPSSSVPAGDVALVLYHTTRNPTSVPKGSTVVLALSTGASTATTTTTVPSTGTTTSTTTTTLAGEGLRAMPNVVGMDQAQVIAAMQQAQLYYVTKGPGADSPAWTSVVSEVPVAGTMVKWHATVTLNVKE